MPATVTSASLVFASASGASHAPPSLVVDLGGGHVEMMPGKDTPSACWSMKLGCARMSERHLLSNPPTQAGIDSAAAEFHADLDAAIGEVPLAQARTLVVIADLNMTVTVHALDFDACDRERSGVASEHDILDGIAFSAASRV